MTAARPWENTLCALAPAGTIFRAAASPTSTEQPRTSSATASFIPVAQGQIRPNARSVRMAPRHRTLRITRWGRPSSATARAFLARNQLSDFRPEDWGRTTAWDYTLGIPGRY